MTPLAVIVITDIYTAVL